MSDEKPNIALIAGAVAMIAMGYCAIQPRVVSTKEVEEIIGEAFNYFPDYDRQEIAMILQAMQVLGQAATEGP